MYHIPGRKDLWHRQVWSEQQPEKTHMCRGMREEVVSCEPSFVIGVGESAVGHNINESSQKGLSFVTIRTHAIIHWNPDKGKLVEKT